jgi:ADP-ribosylglycohydrolase
VRKGKGLTEEQRDDFEDLLRGLTTQRQRIRDVMGFAIDNSEAAGEIVQVLTEALTLDETPIPTKIARLFLVSDILHNSTAAVRNAHAYRSLYVSFVLSFSLSSLLLIRRASSRFQKQLPNVFESFSTALRNAAGRMSAEQLKEQVMRVLRVWEAWSVYPQPFLATLHVRETPVSAKHATQRPHRTTRDATGNLSSAGAAGGGGARQGARRWRGRRWRRGHRRYPAYACPSSCHARK